ncbi:serine hydrolase domain-containing protein [Virgibacillus halophilus]|uniref:Serine hydrolase domain-containing protein n=1 Tax=Tigheibacillus halophilus TaxID=361280 RepID=A0ABU5C955_9BACI|nr:serine hydrolase domain-containing protein [Virgibacillus halophilus]
MLRKTMPAMFIFVFMLSYIVLDAGTISAAHELPQVDPAAVHMLDKPLEDLDTEVERAIGEDVMPGAVVAIAKDGKIVKQQAYGYAARYIDSDFSEMENPVQMQTDTIFDIASMSKLFTATAIMQLWDQGAFDLNEPVAQYIPEFAKNGKGDITIKQLLTHTSGLRPGPSKSLYEVEGDREDRLKFAMEDAPQTDPDTDYIYSDINFMTLGVLIERISGQREDVFVREHITEPLEMRDTMYQPPAGLKDRIAATEYQPWTNRGLVWGSVHDENAWALDGVAGHAGVFSTAADLSVFAEMILHNGSYQGIQVLSKKAIKLIQTNWNGDFPGQDHGLGWELNQDWYMDALADENAMGHTGYTGTSIVINPNNQAVTILLTNRVHPTRETVSTNSIRKKVSEKAAHAIYGWSAKGFATFCCKIASRWRIREQYGLTRFGDTFDSSEPI